MATRVSVSETFDKDLKRLHKKYPGVGKEVLGLITQLEQDERPGDKIPGVGYDVYKVRLRNPAAGKGKSGGFRAIYYVRIADQVVLVTLYSKSEESDVPIEKLRQIVETLPLNESEENPPEA